MRSGEGDAMRTERNILIAFILNLLFSLFEFVGGVWTGSVAIVSDAVHDLGDAVSIGISFFLEKKSERKPDETYTYGYGRYSVLGGVTMEILTASSLITVTENSVSKVFTPSGENVIFIVFSPKPFNSGAKTLYT